MRAVDWVLLITCGALLIAGPAMALQEWSRHEQALALSGVQGDSIVIDEGFRSVWREGLLLGVIVAGVSGLVVALRVARQPTVRALSGRLMLLLLSGMVLLDLTFLIDGIWFVHLEYAIRGSSIVWLYPVAAILMGGALVRLTEVEDAFATAAGPTSR